MKGTFIDIEGLDGSGKTTQMQLLCARLDKQGVPYRRIKLPDYGSESSALVRMYLNGEFGKSAQDVNAYAASAFYAVDRFASYTTDWGGCYNSGGLILADRYAPANAIYQMTKLPRGQWDAFLDWLDDFEYERIRIPRADTVIFLDMPVEVSQKLMTRRYNGDESRKDVHECDVAFLNNCREAALYAAKKNDWRIVECARNGEPIPMDELNECIYAIVDKTLRQGI